MDASRIDRLARLAELHAAGALSDAEFDAGKAKLLSAPTRWPLYVGAAVLALALATAAAIGAGLWIMRDVAVAPPAGRSHATARRPAATATPASVAVARSPAEQLNEAFRAATGHADAFTRTVDGETITTEPIEIVALPFGRALLTKTETKDGCHACTGFIGIYYLDERDGGVTIAKSYAEAVQGWGWGAAPDYRVTTRFTANPAIYSSGGDMHQGYSSSGAIITELTPQGPVKSDLIDTGSDDTGAVEEDSGRKACTLDGKIANVVQDRSFDVMMSGSATFRIRYVKRGGRFVALDTAARSCI